MVWQLNEPKGRRMRIIGKHFICVGIVAALAFATSVHAQTAKPATTAKFAALAIDRDAGFRFGFAFDHTSVGEAEKRALEEVAKRGGSGTVVLLWSGTGCGAYRTIDQKDGNAYGWGLAATQVQAEVIADREVAKHAKGKPTSNRAWACNSTAPQKIKILKNADNLDSVKIGGQTWTAENVVIERFRNGDSIPFSKSFAAFQVLTGQKKPASYCYSVDANCSKFGRFYNWYAVNDPRGFAPEGWRVPSANDWQSLVDGLGGKSRAFQALRAPHGWPDRTLPASGNLGFNALATDHPHTPTPGPEFDEAYFWSSSTIDNGKYINHFMIRAGNDPYASVGNQSGYEPLSVRLIRN